MVLSEAPGTVDLLARSLSHVWKAAPGDVDGFARGIVAWRDRLRDGSLPNHRVIAETQFDIEEKNAAVLTLYRQYAPQAEYAPSARERPHSMA
jgi:hypothetical protein